MHFKLFYKQYDYKPSLSAIKQFKEATGRDLWSTLIRYMLCYVNSQKDGDSVGGMMAKLSDELDFVDAAQLFYCLAKQVNSAVTLDEIEDSMYHAGILPNVKDSEMCEPYPMVLYMIALEVQKYHNSLSTEKKPEAHS